jgi:hypothetical protein
LGKEEEGEEGREEEGEEEGKEEDGKEDWAKEEYELDPTFTGLELALAVLSTSVDKELCLVTPPVK